MTAAGQLHFPTRLCKIIFQSTTSAAGGVCMEEKDDWLEEHPWLAVNDSDVDETLRYSLDEIRIY